MSDTPAISATALTKDYGQGRGIFDLTLEVDRGEVLGFIGPNGAGKTTTLRLFMDLVRPSHGRVSLLGLDAQRDGVQIRRRTGYLPGETPDYPNQTGASILDLLAQLRGGVSGSAISALAERFQLDLGRKYRDYSHGNKQKVWLIQAFMHNPELLLLDEPTQGLDPLMQQVFRELVFEARDRGATVFLSSHVLPEVEELCKRIAIVHEGKLRRVGTLEDLRLSHVRRVTATLRDEPDASLLSRVPGVAGMSVQDHRVECTVSGPMEPLLEALQAASVLTLDSSEMSLEDVFMSLYGRAHDG